MLRDGDAERLSLDLSACKAHYEQILKSTDLADKLTQVFSESSFSENFDPDLMIYSGGFFSDQDKRIFTQIRRSSPEQIAAAHYSFSDPRLEEMLFRYRGRNFPESLETKEQERWVQYCRERLTGQSEEGFMTFDDYKRCIRQLLNEESVPLSAESRAILENLKQYGERLESLVMAKNTTNTRLG